MSETQRLCLQAESALAQLLLLRPGFWADEERKLRAALEVVRRLAT